MKIAYDFFQKEISQKRNINRKKIHMVFSQTSDFEVVKRSFKIQ